MGMSRSGLGKSQMKKSVSGFDIGQTPAVGSFFSGVRQRAQGEEVNFTNTEEMRGKDYVEKLISQ